MVSTIIFDWGGVLAPDANQEAARLFSIENGVNREDFQKDMDSWEEDYSKGEDAAPLYERLSEKYDIPASVIESTHNSVRPWEMYDLAKEIKKKGYKIAILSNQINPRTEAIRAAFGVDFFDHTFFSNEVGMMKPHADFFNYALEKMGEKAENCLFIDDHEINIEAAKKLGFHTILFTDFNSFKRKIEAFLKK